VTRRTKSPARDAGWWEGTEPDRRQPCGVIRSAQYVKVRDGTGIAIDLFLPDNLTPGEQVPTLITATPYIRAVEFRNAMFRSIASRLAFLGTESFVEEVVTYRYAYVLIDLRGAGASYGQRSASPLEESAADGSDVVDWIVSQPWSNGRVGTTGVSGHGLAAAWIASAGNPAVRAMAPRFTAFDNYTATHPGGGSAKRFLVDIGNLVAAMDRNELWKMPDSAVARLLMRTLVRGVKPVDEDRDRSQLAAAVADHAGNSLPPDQFAGVEFRDDVLKGTEKDTLDDLSLFRMVDRMEELAIPIFCEAGWMDANFQRELLNLHNTASVRIPGSRITIGPWGHGGKFYSSPLAERRTPSAFNHAAELTRFFDVHLRDAPDTETEPIRYFTMGEERWKSASTWPPPSSPWTLHTGAGGRLAPDAPTGAEDRDRYTVDFRHGTGVHSRYGKHLTSELYPVVFPDRRRKDLALLVYDSEPLEADREVTGHPVAHLFVTSTADDGMFIVYLEDIDPSGTVRTITDGWLRARDRRLDSEPPMYWQTEPRHSFRRADAEPLHPGEIAELAFDLHPTSWLFRRGHRVRVAIAGADRDNLGPIGEEARPVIEVYRSRRHPSRIELPVVDARHRS
jgi:putative CocE/NonD family hydrolase